MVFTVGTLPPADNKQIHNRKTFFPFEEMKLNPGTGFIISKDAEQINPNIFALVRTRACQFNKKHLTNIKCKKQNDGSMRVWNESTDTVTAIVQQDNTLDLLIESVKQSEAKKQAITEPVQVDEPASVTSHIEVVKAEPVKQAVPTRDQFVAYCENLLPGGTFTLGLDYVHRFAEFELWVLDLEGFDTEVKYNPPSLKISRKAGK